MEVVLDACALIAFLRDEDGAQAVELALQEGNCVAHAINLCEVYKDCLTRGESQSKADELIEDLMQLGLLSNEDLDEELWKHAAKLKAEIGQVSYADCFALALTKRLEAVLYSSDHHELDPVAAQGIVAIKFIR
jgi:PIN domain nuclease of toxin-antitoxin system